MRRFFCLFLPLLAACSAAMASRVDEVPGTGFTDIDMVQTIPRLGKLAAEHDKRSVPAPAAGTPKPPEASKPETPQAQERVMIYNGSIALQVPDPRETETAIAAIAKEAGGWVHRIDKSQTTIRVPAAKFEQTLAKLVALGQIIDKKIAATDVTDQFRDLRIRLENAEKVRTRLAALLDKAKDVKEALEVERELGRVTEEIERLKGQIAAMQDQVAFSTIVVDLQRTVPHARAREWRMPFPWVRGLGAETLFRFER